MVEERLFRLAPAGLSINAYYVTQEGWALTIRVRRADESWNDTVPDQAMDLSTSELVDFIEATLHTRLL